MRITVLMGIAAVAVLLPALASAAERQAYFGDLHLHTAMSMDAYASRTNTLPEDSYRYARGEEIDYIGQKIRRKAALDFLAVTDHSEYLGAARIADDPKGPLARFGIHQIMNDTTLSFFDRFRKVGAAFGKGFTSDSGTPAPELVNDEFVHSNWQRQIDAAEKYYQPGKFTTFAAYEWTSMPAGANLHRNVIFRGPKYPQRPFSTLDSVKPEDLWTYMDHQRALGVEVMDLPHNSNVSDGRMFTFEDSAGAPISRAYAEQRIRNEPLVEITQHKGTSETNPVLSPADEFASYELMEFLLGQPRRSKLDGSYVRQALGRGLEIEARVGVNPYKLGFVGASDFHSGASSSEEFNFSGAFGVGDSQLDAKRWLNEPIDPQQPSGAMMVLGSAAGVTGVWAEQNTREAIFDALRRREVFATTGPRIQLRLFAGWSYPKDLVKKPGWAAKAYAGGVPMGADLAPKAGAKAPSVAVQALKDPDSGNLDRIQIVKVWLKDGKTQEKVFDIAWAGERAVDATTGKLPVVGSTVDVKAAKYTNSIGAAELATVWSDPEFDAAAPAVYYARVLEIPTPRWTTYLAVKNGLPLPQLVPPAIQERAWSSPVFYRPG
ncbi:MAG: hypothetical protein JWQ90_494 [Hydrocarboniphaga sp.]|uniref:DUF3604 domain-containing protein n=1 Tax=Hydrocarboniphaga sp. TaxID=2033016 RepID=UPI002604D521|nr:DUF3604 domain-containing protein [Hydrocarboniphaga sp.]MDB5968044.1 hypothetical protein [Hydrocarboniphaga sp.]